MVRQWEGRLAAGLEAIHTAAVPHYYDRVNPNQYCQCLLLSVLLKKPVTHLVLRRSGETFWGPGASPLTNLEQSSPVSEARMSAHERKDCLEDLS